MEASKRNGFLHQAKELIKQNTDLYNHTPKELPTCLSVPPWKSEGLPNINMKIPGIEDKRLQTPEERRDTTDAFLNITLVTVGHGSIRMTLLRMLYEMEEQVYPYSTVKMIKSMSVYQQDYIVQTTRLKQWHLKRQKQSLKEVKGPIIMLCS